MRGGLKMTLLMLRTTVWHHFDNPNCIKFLSNSAEKFQGYIAQPANTSNSTFTIRQIQPR